ncbi:MAG: P-loop NTPase fold protein [Anaerolineales bacterium]
MPEPSKSSLLSILSDQPADEDQLNFDPYAKPLTDIIADPGTDTPLTIGVFGGWGQGKTSLMRMVQRRLAERTAGADFPVRAVWFNAWLYSHQPALWRALISRVLHGARGFETLSKADRANLRQLEARLYGAAAPAGGHLTLPAGALAGLSDAALPPVMGLELLRQTSSDPREKARARRAVQEQWSLVEGYLAEYRRLSGEALPPDIAEIAAHFAGGDTSQPAASDPSPDALRQPADDVDSAGALLAEVLDDETLTTLCFDHYRPVYNQFKAGMGQAQKIQRLLDYCQRHGQVAELLNLVANRWAGVTETRIRVVVLSQSHSMA